MSEIKWPTDVGEGILEIIDDAYLNCEGDNVRDAWAKIKQFVIDNTTWRTHELHCQATVYFTAALKVPPGIDFDEDHVVSEIVQSLDGYVDIEVSCNDETLGLEHHYEGVMLTDILDEEINDFILTDAT